MICEEGWWPEIGPVLPGAVEAIQYLAQFARPVVQTARLYPYDLSGTLRVQGAVERDLRMIRDVLDAAGLKGIKVYPEAKVPGLVYLDDRGMNFPPRQRAWFGIVPKVLAKLGIKDEKILYPDFIRGDV